MARVGIKRVLLCAAVVAFGVPAAASATPVITAPTATHVAPTFSWTDADPTVATFHVLTGSTCGAATEIDPNATSPFTHSALALDGSDDGPHCYVVQTFDGSLPPLPIDSANATIFLDTVNPLLSPTLPSNTLFVHGTVSVPYTASDAAPSSGGPSVVLEYLAPSAVLWTQVDSGAGPSGTLSWNTGALADGAYGLRVTAADPAGNETTVTRATINVDNSGPALAPTFPTNGTFVRGPVSVPFTAPDAAGIATVVLQVDAPGLPVSWTTVDTDTNPSVPIVFMLSPFTTAVPHHPRSRHCRTRFFSCLPAGGFPIAVATQELPELAFAFFLVDAVLLLVSTRELIVLAGDHAQPVIGQLAPPFSHAAAQLLPLAFKAIPVHVSLLSLRIHAVLQIGSWRQ